MSLYVNALASAASTTWTRFWRGTPACPSWTYTQEIVVGILRDVNDNATLDQVRANELDNPPVAGTKEVPATGCPVKSVWLQTDDYVEGASSGGGVIVHIHGGAFVQGTLKSTRRLASKVALATGCRVLLIELRLAPEHKFPAPIEDTIAVYKWLLQAEQGYTPSRVAFVGESSGGNVILGTALKLARENEAPLPGFLILLSPNVDLSDSIPVTASNTDYIVPMRKAYNARLMYAGSEEAFRNTLMSPLLAEDLNILAPCPILIETGAVELHQPRIAAFAAKAKAAGCNVEINEYADMPHVFQAFGSLFPEATAASFKSIAAFTKAHFQ